MPIPVKPNQHECERLRARGHVPFAAWCYHCVTGRGRDDAHRQRVTEPECQRAATELPEIGAEYLLDRTTEC